MKKIFVPLMTVAVVVALLIGGCMPAAPPEAPPEAPPVTPPPEAPPVTPPPEAPPEAPPVEEERLEFAYILFGDLAHPFLAETAEGFTEACDLFGVDLTVSVAEYDEAKMISLVDAAVAADVDGIFTFSWQDPHSLTPSIQRALDKGINFVHMSSKNPDFTPAELPHIGFDVYDQGYTLGTDWVWRLEAEGLATDVQIATFLTKTDSPLELDRRQGFLNALTDGGIEYTSSDPYPTDPTQAVAMDQIKAYLLANPETNLIFGSGGTPTAACFQAVQALFPPGEVWVAGFDLLPEAVVGVRAGYGACNQDEVLPYGFLAATALYLRIKHPPLTIGNLPIATVMIDQTNVDVYFPD